MNATRKDALEIFRAPVQLKLSAPWISVMFCYIYGDYFGLYVPGTLKSLLEGHATQSMLLAFTAMMVIPCLMPFLAVTLKAPVNRAVNISLASRTASSSSLRCAMPGCFTRHSVLSKSR